MSRRGRPRNIAYLSFTRFPSAFAQTVQVLSMCEAFMREGIDVTLYATRSSGTEVSEKRMFSEYGVELAPRVVWIEPSDSVWLTRWRVATSTLRSARKYELCYTRSVWAAFVCWAAGAPCMVELHSPNLPKLERAALRVLKQSPRVRFVSISAVLAGMLARRYGICRDSIVVEHDAWGSNSASGPVWAVHDFDDGAVHALYVGSFYPGRGLETIVAVAEQHPAIHFVAVGGELDDMELGQDGGSLPGNLSAFRRIPHAAVGGLLRQADILLMPYGKKVTIAGSGDTSRFCSPLKLFEYLGAARAIIASRLPSVEEVLVDGSNALLVEPDDVQAWSHAVESLATNAQLREKLARGALQTSREHTWEARARRLLESRP